jgi:hypothetical protein
MSPAMPLKFMSFLNCGDGCAWILSEEMIGVRKRTHSSWHAMSWVWLISALFFGFWQTGVMLRSQFVMSFFVPSIAYADVTFV